MKEREVYLDTVAGIFIIFIIFGHCADFAGIDTIMFPLFDNLFNCCMPWFFFKSGMFAHPTVSFRSSFVTSLRCFGKPYFFFTLIGLFCYWFTTAIGQGFSFESFAIYPLKQGLLNAGGLSWSMHLWFLVTLLFVKSLFPIICKFSWGGAILCAIVGGVFAYMNSSHLWFAWTNIFPALFFFCAGYLLNRNQYMNGLFIISIFIFILSFIFPAQVAFRLNVVLNNSSYFLWVVYSLSSIIVYNNIFYRFAKGYSFCSFIGQKSLYFFSSHWVIGMIFSRILSAEIESTLRLVVIFLGSISILGFMYPFISKTKIRRFFGL